MKYKEYNDSELLSYIREENEEANEIIYEKYKPLIINMAKKLLLKYNSLGIELNDLIGEGMVGLSYAINTYEEVHNVPFYIYAKKCIEGYIKNYIRKLLSLKNRVLNNAVSYDNTHEDNNLENLLGDSNTPLNIMLLKEEHKELLSKLKEELTPLEFKVFLLKIEGYSYKDMASILKKEPKNIDNALSRIKNKMSR